MLVLKKNLFLDKGVCRYDDELGNILRVYCNKDTSKLRLEFVLKDEDGEENKVHSVEPLELSIPLNEANKNGVTIQIKTLNENLSNAELEESFNRYRTFIQDAINLIPKWVKILECVNTLENEDAKEMAYFLANNNEEKEDAIYQSQINALIFLDQQPESAEYAQLNMALNHIKKFNSEEDINPNDVEGMIRLN